jgi:cytochrome c oxidase assembly factor CtaG
MAAVIASFATILLCLSAPPVLAHVPGDNVSFTDWNWRPDVLLVLLLFGFTYARGWIRVLNRSSHAAKKWQPFLYLTGLVSVGVALVSPIDALASTVLTIHMVQHLLLLMIAPLLLLLADPLAALVWGLPTRIRPRIIARLFTQGCLFRDILSALTLMPVTWSIYVVNLWAWHHPAFYQLALRNEWVHDLQHLLFFFTAVVFWWPIVNPAPRLHGSISYGYRIIYLVAATLQNTLLGMAISIPERVLYPFYATVPWFRSLGPVDDQALGGGIMWVSGHMYLIPILVLIYRLLACEESLHGHPMKQILSRVQD